MRKLLLLLMLVSTATYAEELTWLKITAAASTATGIANYVGTIKSDEVEQIVLGLETPAFIHISNIVIIDQSGNLKKASEFPWGGGKLVSGNEIYIRTENIIDMQSINSTFSKELDNFVKN